MSTSKCVWRIDDGYCGDTYIAKEFTLNNTALPELHIVLDPSNDKSVPKEKFRLDFIFPKATTALKVKYQILVMKEATVSEFTGKVSLSQDACPVTVSKFVEVTNGKILDSIICIIEFDHAENDKPLVPLTYGFTDVVLESRDKCRYSVHRCVLAAHSPVFHDMFTNDMAAETQSSGVVAISDLDSGVLDVLLEFVYNANANVIENEEMTQMTLMALFEAAVKYKLDALKDACEGALVKRLNADTVVDTLVLAAANGAGTLKLQVVNFIITSGCGTDLIDTAKFSELERDHPQLAYDMLMAILCE